MAHVLKVDSEGKPFNSMKMIVCKTEEEAKDMYARKKEGLLNPQEKTEDAVWGQTSGVHDAFGHTFIGRKDNILYEIVLYEGAGPASNEDLARMHQQYLAERRELDSLIGRIMKW